MNKQKIWVVHVSVPHMPSIGMFHFGKEKVAQKFVEQLKGPVKRLFGPGSDIQLKEEKLLDEADLTDWFSKPPATEDSVAKAPGNKRTDRRSRLRT